MVGPHSLSMCCVEFTTWSWGFVVVGLDSLPLGWVGLAAVRLHIRHGWVSLAVIGLCSLRWVGFVAIGLHSTQLGWTGLDIRRHSLSS